MPCPLAVRSAVPRSIRSILPMTSWERPSLARSSRRCCERRFACCHMASGDPDETRSAATRQGRRYRALLFLPILPANPARSSAGSDTLTTASGSRSLPSPCSTSTRRSSVCLMGSRTTPRVPARLLLGTYVQEFFIVLFWLPSQTWASEVRLQLVIAQVGTADRHC